MFDSRYDLSTLKADYKTITADKKKASLNPLDLMRQLNKNVKIDEILIKEGYEHYQRKEDLSKNKSFENYEALFKYVVKNLDQIEEKYLVESDDHDLIQKAKTENQNEYNFLLNKNSVSKFIRDEASHYQKVLEQCMELQEEDEKGIQAKKMHLFLIKLFKNEHTAVIKNHSSYLDRSEEELEKETGSCLLSYGEEVKQLPSEGSKNQFMINQEEILDFLTFWLKKQSQNNIFILYSRTPERLQKQSKILLNKSFIEVAHPSRMTKGEINNIQMEQAQASINPPEENNDVLPENIQVQQGSDKIKECITRFINPQRNYSTISYIQSDRKEKTKEEQKEEKRAPTKGQILKKEMKSLFDFGCKRRYKLNKNTTFDDLEQELTSMNLQKFMFFCHFFELPAIISKDIIAEYFKMHAINRQRIDFERFQQIVVKLTHTDDRIIDNLINRAEFQARRRRGQINSSKKIDGKMSKYRFQLRPVNGKDISSMKRELEYRKLEKQVEKEEKDHKVLVKKEKVEHSRINTRSISNLTYSKVTGTQKQLTKEPLFNPEKLILEEAGRDQLWDAYEAKIWKREDKSSKNILETILSKRINRGTSIINKINSERSLLYE